MNESELGIYKSEEEKRAAEEFEASSEAEVSVEKEDKKPFDAIIVLGCGPVQKPLSELHPEQFETSSGWQMNMEAKMRTIAAGQAYLEGLTNKIILTGGKTGGTELPSESETMKNMLIKKFQIPEDKIIIEDKSTNTIENFAHVVNIIDQDPGQYSNVAILSNQYHVERAQEIGRRFLVEAQGQGAEELLAKRSLKYQKLLDKFFNNPAYQKKLEAEVKWSRGLKEIPLYWLPSAMPVENPERLKNILEVENVQEVVNDILVSQGIEGGLDEIEDLNQVREIIREVPRVMPPGEWATLENQKEKEPKSSKIFLLRHGESVHNFAEVPYFAGGSLEQDADLTAKGIESATKVAEKLKNEGIDILVCSDLKRSLQTAEVIVKSLGKDIEIVQMEGLREVHVGELTGKTREQVRNEGSDEAKKALELFLSGDIRQINFPGGDTYETASKRVQESLNKIVQEHGDNAKIAIVGHGNINKVILSLMFPDEFDFVNQLNLSHENVVELTMTQEKNKQIEFRDIKLYGEGEAKGLI